jgi:hypothetical protein
MPTEATVSSETDPQDAADSQPTGGAYKIGLLPITAFCGVTFSILGGQIVLSRLFAGIMTYYYAFMLISLAMLGLAAGGLIVQMGAAFFRIDRFRIQASILSLAMGLAAFCGTLAILRIYPNLSVVAQNTGLNFWPLAGIFLSIFPFFLVGGTVVSLVLGHGREQFAKLYAADLVAAALGCIVAVLMMAVITPVEAIIKVLAVIPFVSAALFALDNRRKILSVSALALAALFMHFGSVLSTHPEIARPAHINSLKMKTFVNEWNTFSSVRVHPGGFFSWCLSPTYKGPKFPMLLLMIDGIGGTSIVRFDGKPQTLKQYEYLDYDLTALGQNLVPVQGRQLIIGPGGGFDVLQSVRRGRSDITIVEINPLVARVVNEDLAPFSGSPYSLPGVRLYIGNGRTFLKRSPESWKLITLTWVDTGGSPQALAFSENFLYTVDAYKEYLQHLQPDGMLSFTRALDYPAIKIDALRGISVAVEALQELGVKDPGSHMIIAASNSPYFMKNWTMCNVLVKKSSFTIAEVEQSQRFFSGLGFHPVWLPDGSLNPDSLDHSYSTFSTLIRQIITSSDRQALYESASLDVTPTTDDNPFYFVERAGKNREAGTGIKDLIAYLGIQAILVVPFLFLPLLPRWKELHRIGTAEIATLAYFSLLGAAFMLVEIEFFNVFALVLGSPTFALATVLSSLLVFSGLGSLLVGSVEQVRKTSLPVIAFAGVVVSLILFLLFKNHILSSLVALPFAWRVLGTAACVAPPAFFMGMPMPTGMSMLRSRKDLLLWGWALNGAFSVFASTAALYLAMTMGITRTFQVGLLFYSAAGLLLPYFARAIKP